VSVVKSWLKKLAKTPKNAKIAIRNIRRDALDAIRKQQKNAEISEDEMHDLEKSNCKKLRMQAIQEYRCRLPRT
jgi:ribosome recycling factor